MAVRGRGQHREGTSTPGRRTRAAPRKAWVGLGADVDAVARGEPARIATPARSVHSRPSIIRMVGAAVSGTLVSVPAGPARTGAASRARQRPGRPPRARARWWRARWCRCRCRGAASGRRGCAGRGRPRTPRPDWYRSVRGSPSSRRRRPSRRKVSITVGPAAAAAGMADWGVGDAAGSEVLGSCPYSRVPMSSSDNNVCLVAGAWPVDRCVGGTFADGQA